METKVVLEEKEEDCGLDRGARVSNNVNTAS
jgi:hypothetical protein